MRLRWKVKVTDIAHAQFVHGMCPTELCARQGRGPLCSGRFVATWGYRRRRFGCYRGLGEPPVILIDPYVLADTARGEY